MKTIIIGVCLLLAQGCASEQIMRERSTAHYRAGISYLSEGDSASAIREFTEAERLSMDNPQILNALGLAYLKRGELEISEQKLKQALELDSKLQETINNISLLNNEKKKWDNTINEFSKTIKNLLPPIKNGDNQKTIADKMTVAASALKEGNYREAVLSYGAVLLLDGENKEAVNGIKTAVRLRDEAITKRFSTGIRAYMEGNYYPALIAFNEILKIDSSDQDALKFQKESKTKIEEATNLWLKTGIDAYKKGDMNVALISFKKVLYVDPVNKDAKEYMGKIVDVPKPINSSGKEIEKHYLRGIEFYTEGKYREAVEEWRKVIELDPKHEKALFNIDKAKRKLESIMDIK